MRDQNGNQIHRNIKRHDDGTWGCNVWFGSYPPTSLRRNYYKTRQQARNADISHDDEKQTGLVRIGAYLQTYGAD